MAPEKRNALLQWLPAIITVITIAATIAASWTRIEGAQEERERVDNAQWRRLNELEQTVGGVREEVRGVGEGIEELRFNVRRFMEDGGIRYIERGR